MTLSRTRPESEPRYSVLHGMFAVNVFIAHQRVRMRFIDVLYFTKRPSFSMLAYRRLL